MNKSLEKIDVPCVDCGTKRTKTVRDAHKNPRCRVCSLKLTKPTIRPRNISYVNRRFES